MAGNSFGSIFKLTTFGESHGKGIGGIIDGCPAGLILDLEAIQCELDRRKPGQSSIVTQRKESDTVQFLSGLFEGKTTGTPIGFVIFNEDQKSKDYSHIKDSYRPSHADYVYDQKYGFRDYRGGGRSSARETASRVVAGAIAKQLLSGIKINAYVSAVGEIKMNSNYADLDFNNIESNSVRCPDPAAAREMESYIKNIRKQGDTVGGIVSCVISGVPIGLGEPVFNKLHAELARAMLSINAVKGFEYGSGFEAARMKGSDHNDLFNTDGSTKTNYSGGVQEVLAMAWIYILM
jgi:chorismate synthase